MSARRPLYCAGQMRVFPRSLRSEMRDRQENRYDAESLIPNFFKWSLMLILVDLSTYNIMLIIYQSIEISDSLFN